VRAPRYRISERDYLMAGIQKRVVLKSALMRFIRELRQPCH
jgi:hypothetical protein